MTASLWFLALAAGLVALTGMRGLPTLVLAIRPRSLKVWFLETFEAQTVLERSDDLGEYVRRIRDLGFTSLGIKAERLPLWGGVYREASLVSTDPPTYASIVLGPEGRPATAYFYSPLAGGGLIFTRTHALGPEQQSPDTSVRNVVSGDLGLVLQDHRGRLEESAGRGLKPVVGRSQAARVEATHAFYATRYARSWMCRSPILRPFLLSLLLFGVAIVLAATGMAGGR